MKVEVSSCDFGISQKHGTCGLDTRRVAEKRELTRKMRLARAAAGTGFLVVALSGWRVKRLRPLAVVAGWFGISHVVAGSTGFSGCPELGAIPSLRCPDGEASVPEGRGRSENG